MSLAVVLASEHRDTPIYLLGCVCLISNALCRSHGIEISEKAGGYDKPRITTTDRKNPQQTIGAGLAMVVRAFNPSASDGKAG